MIFYSHAQKLSQRVTMVQNCNIETTGLVQKYSRYVEITFHFDNTRDTRNPEQKYIKSAKISPHGNVEGGPAKLIISINALYYVH